MPERMNRRGSTGLDQVFEIVASRASIAANGATPQSHFGAKPKSVSRPLALPIRRSRRISSSDNAKSKISIFSDSRSIRDVRGIAETFCCTSQRRQTWAAVLRCALPDPRQRLVVLDPALRDRTIGDHSHAVTRAGLPDLGLVEIGMVFDLVADQRLRA